MYIAVLVVLLPALVTPGVDAGYITTIPGDLPLIISSPHGGYQKPAAFTRRDAGCLGADGECVWTHTSCTEADKDFENCAAKTVRDSYTQEIAKGLREELCNLYNGQCPTLVYSDLYRAYLDPNREINEATFGYQDVIPIYNEYHGKITAARSALEQREKGGLVLDIHGQVRTNYTMLGYLVYKSYLNEDRPDKDKSSIRGLADRHPEVTFDFLLRGQGSLGAEMMTEGEDKVALDNVPNPARRAPGSDGYFNGGYITKTHGSRYGGKVDAIQVEVNSAYRQATGGGEDTYVKSLAKSVKAFLDRYYM